MIYMMPETVRHLISDAGNIPNNENLPLTACLRAVNLPDDDPASGFEELFNSNNWGNDWRNGVYPCHHYHSTAHEVLGVYSGSATIRFGGEPGVDLTVHKGDVVIIPAGVGHKRLSSSQDFAVVGAYPDGQFPDMNYGETGERPQVDKNIAKVKLPTKDPVSGRAGITVWE